MAVNANAQKLVDILSAKSGVKSVTVGSPTALHLKEIASKYTVLPNTDMFIITFKSGSTEGVVQIIAPEEHYKTIDDDYLTQVDFMTDITNLVKNMPDTLENITLYFHPGNSQTEMLRGHSLVPISAPSYNLHALLTAVKNTQGVVEAFAYDLYTGNEGDVVINCIVVDLTPNMPHNEILDFVYTPLGNNTMMIPIQISQDIVDNSDLHQEIIDKLVSDIAKL